MYEQRFGLKKNPFRLTAEGSAVFVGPQQAKIISSLQNGLSGSDNAVVLSGPAGIGKTAILTRALETNKAHQMVASIGRMRLASDEVLELLLGGFGVSRQPTGTVQRFAAFQRILAERTAANIRIVIVVEDALRIGDDALLELEALTADNTGAGGANMVLMGTAQVHDYLARPELARLKQRVRKPQRLEAFSQAEVLGYLKHLVRVAGGEFERLFADDAAAMVFRCSAGIPRVINSICDAALSAAIDTDVTAVNADLVRQVALDVYDIRPSARDADAATKSYAAAATADSSSETANVASAATPEKPRNRTSSSQSVDRGRSSTTAGKPVIVPTIPLAKPQDRPESVPVLPPVVAAALAQEREESMTEPTNEFPKFTLAEAAAAKDLIADTGMTEVPTLSPAVDDSGTFDVADDALIADTGMTVRPEPVDDNQLICDTGMTEIPSAFHPDPELDITPSQLVRQNEDKAAKGDDDDLPTLTPAAEAAEASPPGSASNQADDDLLSLEAEPTAIFEKPDFDEPAECDAGDEAPAKQVPASMPAPVFTAPHPPSAKAEPRSQSPRVATGNGTVKPAATNHKTIPDLDKLEAAISAARRPGANRQSSQSLSLTLVPDALLSAGDNLAEMSPAVEAETKAGMPDLPEITLDQTLEDQRKEGEKLDAMAAELAKINSLEEISDLMAETLFGREFEQFATEALANPPARGMLPGEDEENDVMLAVAGANGSPASSGGPANDAPMVSPQIASEPLPRARPPEPRSAPAPAKSRPPTGVVNAAMPAAQNSSDPESIEDQIETSITQTLKAINPADVPDFNDDDEDKPRGLFGRLKRSFKN